MGQVRPWLRSTEISDTSSASGMLQSEHPYFLALTSLPQRQLYVLRAQSFPYIEYTELSWDMPVQFTSSVPYTVQTLTAN